MSSTSSAASIHVEPVLRSEGGAWSVALTIAVLTLVVQLVFVGVAALLLAVFNCMKHDCAEAFDSGVVIEIALLALLQMLLAVPARLAQSWATHRSLDAVAGARRASATRKLVFTALVVSPLVLINVCGLLFRYG